MRQPWQFWRLWRFQLRGRQVGDGMGGGRNGCFWGRPEFWHIFVENAVFSRVLAKNRGTPKKAAVPTTTHPIPHLTPSDQWSWQFQSSRLPPPTVYEQKGSYLVIFRAFPASISGQDSRKQPNCTLFTLGWVSKTPLNNGEKHIFAK